VKHFLTCLSDVIFPPRCLTCHDILDHYAGLPLCPSCFSEIKFIASPICICCGIPFSGTGEPDHLCGECIISPPAFSSARAVFQYKSTLLETIHRFKYNERVFLGKILGKIMAEYPYPAFNIKDFTLVVPVPLHSKRLRERGFNQSVILAREISRCLQIPLDFLALKRNIHTEPQVRLGKKQRSSNVRGAFDVSDSSKIRDRKIILVDDVYTTGSTIKECSRVLMKNEASSVAVLTVARAV
jgi:ComF family protein